jgi:hypothetical protein
MKSETQVDVEWFLFEFLSNEFWSWCEEGREVGGRQREGALRSE